MEKEQATNDNFQLESVHLQQSDAPSGYKRTEIGVIPEDWEVTTIHDLFDFLRTASISRAELSDTGDVAYIHYGDIHTRWNYVLDFSVTEIPLVNKGKIGLAVYLRDGDLIIADASEDEVGVGKSIVIKNLGHKIAISGLHTILLRSKDDRLYDGFKGYLQEIQHVKAQFRRVATGLKVFGISKRAMNDIQIPLPPLNEQRAIAAALSDADGLIGALDALIAKKRAAKQGAMQQLLTGRTRLPGFTGEWETKRLGDITTFLPTANNPRADLNDNGEIEYIHYGDVHAQAEPVLDCNVCALPYIDRGKIGNAAYLKDGDLIMVDASEDLEGTGKSVEIQGVRGKDVVAGLHTILCRGNLNQWAMGFKAYPYRISSEFKSALVRIATGISVYAISKKELAEIETALPPVFEQEA